MPAPSQISGKDLRIGLARGRGALGDPGAASRSQWFLGVAQATSTSGSPRWPPDLSFARLSIGPAAHALGLADPAIRWAGATLHDGGAITYLTTRPVSDDADELGLITRPSSTKLTDQANDLLHRWARERPAQPVISAYPAPTPADQLVPGTHVTRPDTHLTIAW